MNCFDNYKVKYILDWYISTEGIRMNSNNIVGKYVQYSLPKRSLTKFTFFVERQVGDLLYGTDPNGKPVYAVRHRDCIVVDNP